MQIPSVSGLFQSKLGAVGMNASASSQSVASSFSSQYTSAQSSDQTDYPTNFFEMNIVPGTDSGTAQQSASDSAVSYNPVRETAASAVTKLVTEAKTTGVNNTGSDANTNADNSQGEAMVDFAEQYLGTPYVWGGEDLVKGTDCSGFTQSVYAHFGIKLPRTAYRQSTVGTTVDSSDMSNLQPGDLLFFKTSDYAPVTHVAMYIGDGKVIHAAGKKYGVIISKINKSMKKELVTVKRILQQ
jgi:cell wall-associated NlpC family hydrolase